MLLGPRPGVRLEWGCYLACAVAVTAGAPPRGRSRQDCIVRGFPAARPYPQSLTSIGMITCT
jgi:hypothetical protein